MKSLVVELAENEARALANMANLMNEFVDLHQPADEPDPGVPALVSGAMKLETALVAEGCPQ